MSGSCPAPLYTTFDSVKVRLTNKVQFQADPKNLQEGELPNVLLAQCIFDAETFVEQDLRSRYTVPFVSISKGTFDGLPDHTKRAIRTAVDWKAVEIILGTDFGRGSHINAEGYSKFVTESYNAYIDKLLGRDKEAAGTKHDRFRFSPPLQDLLLAYTNREADDGYKGRIINTDASEHGAESYAVHQINNPSQTYLNRRIKNPAGG